VHSLGLGGDRALPRGPLVHGTLGAMLGAVLEASSLRSHSAHSATQCLRKVTATWGTSASPIGGVRVRVWVKRTLSKLIVYGKRKAPDAWMASRARRNYG
jgi:hypothetical protein